MVRACGRVMLGGTGQKRERRESPRAAPSPLGPESRSYAARATPQRISQQANDRIEARRKTGDFLITPPVTVWGDTEAWVPFALATAEEPAGREAGAKGLGITRRGGLSLQIPDSVSRWGTSVCGPPPDTLTQARQFACFLTHGSPARRI